jgi:hypothetical protein
MAIMKASGLIRILAVILLTTGMLAGCAAEPAVQATATATRAPTETVPASGIDPFGGSQTMLEYENTLAGFRMQYPARWTLDRSQQAAVAIEYPGGAGSVLGLRAAFFMIGAPLTEIGVSDLEGLWASFAESLSSSATLDSRTDYTVSGVPAYQARFVDPEIDSQGWLITATAGEQGYVMLAMVQPPVHFETFAPVFSSMLDSVKLFDSATSASPPQDG